MARITTEEILQQKQIRILLFDIETLPIVSYHWRTFKENISHEQIIRDWCMLSWSAKWLYDNKLMGAILTPREAKARKDKRIIRELWNLFEEADVIIAHNLKGFDRKKSNSRFILNGLNPPTPYQQIDTLEISRKEFGFTSNRLNYLGKIIARDQKIKTDFDLWKQCDAGDKKALDKMFSYNKKDVLLLEEVYIELRPWMSSHPNLAVYGEMDKNRCVVCGSDKLRSKGIYGTPAGRFRAMRCVRCGHINRERHSDLKKTQRKQLLTSTAR